MTAATPRRVPVSSYRLQLTPAFTLFDAAQLVPYLAALGVSECYLSPILTARPGSTHGYDVTDHGRISEALGGDAGLTAFSVAAREHDLGIVLDFVPNHMSTHPRANAWWRSVLENGPSSPYANHFDIDWEPVKPELEGKILLPVLGEQYGETLDRGLLAVALNEGEFHLRYYDVDLPLNPRRLRMLLEHRIDVLKHELRGDDADLTEFLSVLFHLEHLPPYTATDALQIEERQREKDVALGRLTALLARAPRIRAHVEENVRLFNGTPGDPASFDLLHALLEEQPYRLASWRTATHEINYRRFFDVNELAGIRMEEPAVFRAAHARLAQLVGDGIVTGVRLDHVDGLFDPDNYLRQLAALFTPSGAPVWTVVEKILTAGERLSDEWQVHGTSGYDFLNSVNGLFVDGSRAETFAAMHAAFVGARHAFEEIEYESKKVIISSSMASELNVLAHELNRISESHRRFRDFTLDSLQEALREVVACFPVYRSYYRGTAPTAFDRDSVDRAIEGALRRNPALEPTIFQFVRQMLLPQADDGAASLPEQPRRQRFAMKFQQYTAPVHAKGVEDTAFYRWTPLGSLNEVGGDPVRFGRSVDEFHRDNAARLADWPLAMLTTATHDTKRGEDARARLNVLSEMPRSWRAMLGRWSRIAAPVRGEVHGQPAPSPNDEYLFYQAVVSAWPPGLRTAPDEQFVERLVAYMLKAIREAKIHTSWINPAADYEQGVEAFVRETLIGSVAAKFVRSLAPFAANVAWYGMLNSLGQVLLKIASPGVPDVYNGAELWDLSLVDPDNRRPVDYDTRRRVLAELEPLGRAASDDSDAAAVTGAVRALMDSWTDGRIKLWITHAALVQRRRRPTLFLDAPYLPLPVRGAHADHVVAFARLGSQESLVVVVPRLLVGLTGKPDVLPVGPAIWQDTSLVFPRDVPRGLWRNVLTGEPLPWHEDAVPLADALRVLPLGMWIGPRSPSERGAGERDQT